MMLLQCISLIFSHQIYSKSIKSTKKSTFFFYFFLFFSVATNCCQGDTRQKIENTQEQKQ